jgi:L-threonylcarbamoyladenylate synthase
MHDSAPHAELLRLDPGAGRAEAIRRAAECLREGGVVAAPTDTVYGLLCREDSGEALARLRRIKDQPPEKPFQVLVASLEEARRLTGSLSRAAQKLMRCYWPGPLTLVVPARVDAKLAAGERVGLRLPDDADLRALLRESGGRLAATSANRHGAPPLGGAEAIRDELGSEVDLILARPETPARPASSVVRVDGERLEMLREGAVDAAELRAAARYTLAVVAREHEARAAMAAVIARHVLDGQETPASVVIAASRWEKPEELLPAGARQLLQEMGYPCEDLPVRPLGAECLDRADEILVTSEEEARALARDLPQAADRLRPLPLGLPKDAAPPPGGIGVGPGYQDVAVRLEKRLWEICKGIARNTSVT